MSAFLDGNGQLSVEATFYTQELIMKKVACKQALRGDLVVGREKEGELATTFLKFEYLHRNSQCEMLIGRYDISKTFFNSCSFPLCADWQQSDSSFDGEPQGNWGWNSNSRDVVAINSPSFSRPAARACSQAMKKEPLLAGLNIGSKKFNLDL